MNSLILIQFPTVCQIAGEILCLVSHDSISNATKAIEKRFLNGL